MTETLQTLIEALHHPDKNVRGKAAVSIGNLGDIEGLNVLLQTIGEENDLYVREDITWALVRIGDAAVLPLIELLKNENPAARHHAAHTLGKIADARATEALTNALEDEDAMVVAKAAFALGQIGDTRAISAFIGLLGHEHREVQTAVNQVLEVFGGAAIQPLIRAMGQEKWQAREQAADILGLIGSRDAVPVLIEALKDEQWQVRFAAVTALGSIGGGSAKQGVQQMEHDADERVRGLTPKILKRMRR
jgi:HEAT repeat protein